MRVIVEVLPIRVVVVGLQDIERAFAMFLSCSNTEAKSSWLTCSKRLLAKAKLTDEDSRNERSVTSDTRLSMSGLGDEFIP